MASGAGQSWGGGNREGREAMEGLELAESLGTLFVTTSDLLQKKWRITTVRFEAKK